MRLVATLLAATLPAPPPTVDPIVPATMRVEVTYRCYPSAPRRRYSLRRDFAEVPRLLRMSMAGRPLPAPAMAIIRQAIARFDRLFDIEPQCAEPARLDGLVLSGLVGRRTTLAFIRFVPGDLPVVTP